MIPTHKVAEIGGGALDRDITILENIARIDGRIPTYMESCQAIAGAMDLQQAGLRVSMDSDAWLSLATMIQAAQSGK